MTHQEQKNFPSEDVIFLDGGNGSSVLIHKFGATVLSWKCKGKENLFLSSLSKFDNKKAIRGGIPLVFPNFGPWELGPQHGFARIKPWTRASPPSQGTDGSVKAVLTLEDDEQTRAMWNFKFKLEYTVELKADSLVTSFTVHNNDSQPFSFTCLLHTYLRVSSIASTAVSGLQGLTYTDKLLDGKELEEKREKVTIDQNVDRVYKNATQKLVIASEGAEGDPARCIELTTANLPDIVVWNPWQAKAREMADFDDRGFHSMLCVEAGRVVEALQLPPGQAFHSSQTFTAKL